VDVQALGHVVLKVRDRQQSEVFYSCVLGMPILSRISDPLMTFFSLGAEGPDHDFAVIEVGAHAPSPQQDATGLAHVAFKVGSAVEALRLERGALHTSATPILLAKDRRRPGLATGQSIAPSTRGFCPTSARARAQ
jgi:catechol-2,3-dioxygenase